MNKLPNMVELHLKGCKKLKNLPPLWQVPALQVLCLKGLENLQCLCSGDKFFNFPNLKELMLVGLPAFDRWCEVKSLQREQVIFPHLEKLSIEKCEKLTALPEAAAASGQSCSQNHTEIRSAFPCLEKLSIRSCQELIALPEAPLLHELCGVHYKMACSAFPALKVLKLKELDKFQKWGAADEATQGQQIIFPCLQDLSVLNCKNLIALPEGPLLHELCDRDYEKACSAFPALKVLELEKLENFEGWEQVGATQGGDTMFPHLEELSIRDCPKMTALPAGTSSLAPSVGRSNIKTRSAFPKLKKLIFGGLINFKSWGVMEAINGEQWMFPDLETVYIDGSPELTTLPEGPKLSSLTIRGGHQQIFLAAIPRAIDSLSELEFSAVLPPAEQGAFELADSNNIKSPLTSLQLGRNCNLLFHSSALALWTCFVQLQDLEIRYCDALVYWPQEFQSLVSLRNLVIWDCNDLIGYARAAPGQPASERIQLLPNLESLDIGGCKSLVEIFSVPASLKAMKVRGCPKVELESIFGMQQDRPTLNQGLSTDVMASTAVPQLPSSASWDQFLPCVESLTMPVFRSQIGREKLEQCPSNRTVATFVFIW